MSSAQPAWDYAVLKEVAGVLADTTDGLTGKEIGDLLARLNTEDPLPDANKRDRLAEAFVVRQNKDRNSRRIITFIVHAMAPVRYRDRPQVFSLRQDRLNERLRSSPTFTPTTHCMPPPILGRIRPDLWSRS